MFSPTRLAASLAVCATLLLGSASDAAAQTIVTACGTDIATGGMNLSTALAVGGDVRIQCADGADTIQFTSPHSIDTSTTIDGGGSISLIGLGYGVMFVPAGPTKLGLQNLSIRNPGETPTTFAGIVHGQDARVELLGVRVSDTPLPFRVDTIVAQNSTFAGNGNSTYTNVAVLVANTLILEDSTFTDNRSRPFQNWAPNNTSRYGRVVRSTFERNTGPSQWIGGNLLIDDSAFSNNGDPSQYAAFGAGSIYGGESYTEGGPNIGGALDLFGSEVRIRSTTFSDNTGEFGGAIFSYGSKLTVDGSDFDRNRSTIGGGGAILHFASEQLVPLIGWDDQALELRYDKFRNNAARMDGGGVLVRGRLQGDALLFSANVAQDDGGAIAIADDNATPIPPVPLDPNNRSTIAIARGLFVDNSAEMVGGALDTAEAEVRLGNTLIARTKGAADAALQGANLALVYSSITDSQNAGVAAVGAGTPVLLVSNSILSGNKLGNCAGAVGPAAEGYNLQFPDASCGSAISIADPGLNARYAPLPWSRARAAADATTCQADDLVLGVDAYGDDRPAGPCTIGAVEFEPFKDTVGRLPFGLDDPNTWSWLWWLLLLLLLLSIILGFIIGSSRRRRRKHAA